MTKSRAFAAKYCQTISSSVGVTKSRAFAAKCCQNCAILLYCKNISRASPENYTIFFKMNQKEYFYDKIQISPIEFSFGSIALTKDVPTFFFVKY